jgi:O-antigen ligase
VLLAFAGLGLLPAALTSRFQALSEFTTFYDVRGVAINNDNYAIIQRLAFWQSAQAMAAAHPWLGVGLGNFAYAYPAYALLNWPQAIGHAHNIYLNMLAETGVLGLAAYLALWLGIVWLTLAALRQTEGWQRGLVLGLLGAWVGLAAHQVVDYLYVNNTHLLIGAYLGLLAALGGPVTRGGQEQVVTAAA